MAAESDCEPEWTKTKEEMRLKFTNIQTEATAALKRHSRQRRSRSDFFLTSFLQLY